MVFSKPQAQQFAYKGVITSAVMNTINNDFPNAIDKTGETTAAGGGVSGEIDFKSGAKLVLQSGSSLTLTGTILSNLTFDASDSNPNILQASTSSSGGNTLSVLAQSTTYASAAGGNLSLSAGNSSSGAGGNVSVSAGTGSSTGNVTLNAGTGTMLELANTFVKVNLGGTTVLNLVSTGGQIGPSSTGINIGLSAITLGPSENFGTSWQGSHNTQQETIYRYYGVANTSGTVATTLVTVPTVSNSGLALDIWLMRKDISSGTYNSGKAFGFVYNTNGTITIDKQPSSYYALSSSFSVYPNLVVSGNNILVQITPGNSDSTDWQCVVTAQFI